MDRDTKDRVEAILKNNVEFEKDEYYAKKKLKKQDILMMKSFMQGILQKY